MDHGGLMQTVTDMYPSEIASAEESPGLLKFRQAHGGRRFLELMGAYLLADELRGKLDLEQEEIVNRWAMAVNRSPGAC
jgi:hypothetical protein